MNLKTVYDVLANGAAYTYVLVDRQSSFLSVLMIVC